MLRDQGIEESNIPHFLRWVRGFFAGHRGRQRRDLGRKEIESYLSQIAKEPGMMSSWHVEQARQALEWYYEQIRGIPLERRTRKSGASGDADIASEKQLVGR